MPKGPLGDKRPAGVSGTFMKVGQIARGEIKEDADENGKGKAA